MRRKQAVDGGLGLAAHAFGVPLFAAALDGGGDAHGFAVFRDRAARDVDALGLQLVHQHVVGEHLPHAFAR